MIAISITRQYLSLSFKHHNDLISVPENLNTKAVVKAAKCKQYNVIFYSSIILSRTTSENFIIFPFNTSHRLPSLKFHRSSIIRSSINLRTLVFPSETFYEFLLDRIKSVKITTWPTQILIVLHHLSLNSNNGIINFPLAWSIMIAPTDYTVSAVLMVFIVKIFNCVVCPCYWIFGLCLFTDAFSLWMRRLHFNIVFPLKVYGGKMRLVNYCHWRCRLCA